MHSVNGRCSPLTTRGSHVAPPTLAGVELPGRAESQAETKGILGTVRLALMNIADALGDVDGFIEQYDEAARKMPKIAADIAQRLLSVGRIEEAWKAIEAAEHRQRSSRWDWPDFAWEDVRIDVLEALGRKEDAQAARWNCFERSLSSVHLRAYLKRLPDFDEIEVEKKALDYAQRSPNVLQALCFLVGWPALDREYSAGNLATACSRVCDPPRGGD